MLYKNAVEVFRSYVDLYPDEKEVAGLLPLLQSDEQIVSRDNVSGHVVASGLVLHKDKLLLIFHKKLQRYLQPGGHLDDDTTLLEAAQREVLEETGVQTTPYNFSGVEAIPLHIDIQRIPYNEKKQEPEHFHYDCMFLLTTDNPSITLQESEVDGYRWVDLDYAFEDVGICRAVEKIKNLACIN